MLSDEKKKEFCQCEVKIYFRPTRTNHGVKFICNKCEKIIKDFNKKKEGKNESPKSA